jgi:hypothetical protein
VKTIETLEKIDAEEKDPERKKWLVQQEQAQALVKQGEVGKALAILEAGPKKYISEETKKEIAKLKKAWEPKSPAHADARKFIYEKWPGLTTAQMKANLAEAEKALKACEKAGDPYGPVRFRNATIRHAERLLNEAKSLKPGVNAGDDEAAQAIKEISAELRKLVGESE